MRDFESEQTYNGIVLKPRPLQFAVLNLGWILLAVAVSALCYFVDMKYNMMLLIANVILTLMCLCKAITLFSIKYIITEEQIIYIHGVFVRETNFVELYRVVAYQETRTALQWLLGLKDVIIFSMDKNIRMLNMMGMKEKDNIISTIRKRVEYNKKRKGIYEITNR